MSYLTTSLSAQLSPVEYSGCGVSTTEKMHINGKRNWQIRLHSNPYTVGIIMLDGTLQSVSKPGC